MKRTGNHSVYELVVEKFLRENKINYIATNEAKKGISFAGKSIKNFDLIINTKEVSVIVDVKGKQFGYPSARRNVFENWVLEDDIKSIMNWHKILSGNGLNVIPCFWYVYALAGISGEDDFFTSTVKYKGKKYGLVKIDVRVYKKNAKVRSESPKTLNISRRVFRTLVTPVTKSIH